MNILKIPYCLGSLNKNNGTEEAPDKICSMLSKDYLEKDADISFQEVNTIFKRKNFTSIEMSIYPLLGRRQYHPHTLSLIYIHLFKELVYKCCFLVY